MYAFYTFILTLGLLVALPYYLLGFKRYGPTVAERFGFVEGAGELSIWVHAVSVGEVKAVDRLIERLRQELPDRQIVISTTTLTGRQLAHQRDDVDRVVYFPLDIPTVVRRSLGRLRPELVVIAETEIWPNFLRECQRRSVPVVMVNGRISDKSYSRYLMGRRWLKTVLEDYRVLGMQSEMDAVRIRSIGANPRKVVVFGNIKYDLGSSPPSLDRALGDALQSYQPLLVAASTAVGEEQLVLGAYRRLRARHPNLRLLIAPRLPQRFNEVEGLLRAGEFRFRRRSEIGRTDGSEDIILLDSIGELTAVFEYATLVFIGGTLVPRGGHNVLEPARFEKPVLFGPHMENFRDMARRFLAAKAAIQVRDVNELVVELERLLKTPSIAAELGRNGKRLVEENSGATDRALEAIRTCLREAGRGLEEGQPI